MKKVLLIILLFCLMGSSKCSDKEATFPSVPIFEYGRIFEEFTDEEYLEQYKNNPKNEKPFNFSSGNYLYFIKRVKADIFKTIEGQSARINKITDSVERNNAIKDIYDSLYDRLCAGFVGTPYEKTFSKDFVSGCIKKGVKFDQKFMEKLISEVPPKKGKRSNLFSSFRKWLSLSNDPWDPNIPKDALVVHVERLGYDKSTYSSHVVVFRLEDGKMRRVHSEEDTVSQNRLDKLLSGKKYYYVFHPGDYVSQTKLHIQMDETDKGVAYCARGVKFDDVERNYLEAPPPLNYSN